MVGVVILSVLPPAKAQSESAPYPVASAARVAALIEAAARNLDYAPGEVLIKFRDGVGQGGQQRALMALRSRPDAGQMKWIGNVAWLHDSSQPDARILAEQLSSQPEVEYAEPNYIRRPHAVPNDPSYSRQWNFSGINMPGAWDITGGGSSDVIVAVVDTGVTAVPARNLNARTWNGSAIVTTSAPRRAESGLQHRAVRQPDGLHGRSGEQPRRRHRRPRHARRRHDRRGQQQRRRAGRHRLQRAHHAGEGLHELLGRAVRDVGGRHARLRGFRRRRLFHERHRCRAFATRPTTAPR